MSDGDSDHDEYDGCPGDIVYDTTIRIPLKKGEPIKPSLKPVTTADLVRELCSREGVEDVAMPEGIAEIVTHWKEKRDNDGFRYYPPSEGIEVTPPDRIIVVRGDG